MGDRAGYRTSSLSFKMTVLQDGRTPCEINQLSLSKPQFRICFSITDQAQKGRENGPDG